MAATTGWGDFGGYIAKGLSTIGDYAGLDGKFGSGAGSNSTGFSLGNLGSAFGGLSSPFSKGGMFGGLDGEAWGSIAGAGLGYLNSKESNKITKQQNDYNQRINDDAIAYMKAGDIAAGQKTAYNEQQAKAGFTGGLNSVSDKARLRFQNQPHTLVQPGNAIA